MKMRDWKISFLLSQSARPRHLLFQPDPLHHSPRHLRPPLQRAPLHHYHRYIPLGLTTVRATAWSLIAAHAFVKQTRTVGPALIINAAPPSSLTASPLTADHRDGDVACAWHDPSGPLGSCGGGAFGKTLSIRQIKSITASAMKQVFLSYFFLYTRLSITGYSYMFLLHPLFHCKHSCVS